jgi:hypothetical protein
MILGLPRARHYRHRNEESKKVANQSLDTSNKLLANAGEAQQQTAAGVNQFNQNLNNFMRFGRRTYGGNGEFMRTMNTKANEVAAGGQRALEGDLAMHALRTGANTAGYADTAAEARRQSSRDMTNFLANANQQRLQNLTDVEKTGLDESKFPAQISASMYGPSVSGSVGALNPAASAAHQADQNWFDPILGSIIGGAANVGAAAVKGG